MRVGFVLSSHRGGLLDVKECRNGEYETVAPTSTSDRLCKAKKPRVCETEAEYERSNETTTTDRVCAGEPRVKQSKCNAVLSFSFKFYFI